MRATLSLLALASLLAGCGGGIRAEDRLLACPDVALLADAADLTRHRDGQPTDLASLVVDARITGIENGRCSTGGTMRRIEVVFNVAIAAERGPASPGRTIELPLVIAITDASGEVLARQVVRQAMSFPAQGTRMGITTEPLQLLLPVSAQRRGSDYRVLVGFLLTEQELAANRRRGLR